MKQTSAEAGFCTPATIDASPLLRDGVPRGYSACPRPGTVDLPGKDGGNRPSDHGLGYAVQIAGGNLGFSATVPFGSLEVDASLGPLSVTDDIFTVGDPALSGFVGWHAGNFHWQTGVAINTPIGDYEEGEIANIAFNRWSTDVYAAATWLDPAIGLDISAAAGVTFNDENDATNYETGTEFHLEGAITQNFSPQFSLGITGYYYNQLTGDSGAGARLGDFEGEVAAIGGTLGYNFQIGVLPVSTRLKYFHEFAVENRLEGDAGFFTVSMPLWVPQPSAQ